MTQQQAEILGVPEVARYYGKTEAAIRQARARGDEWLPPAFKVAGRIGWRRVDIEKAVEKLVSGAEKEAAKAKGAKRAAAAT